VESNHRVVRPLFFIALVGVVAFVIAYAIYQGDLQSALTSGIVVAVTFVIGLLLTSLVIRPSSIRNRALSDAHPGSVQLTAYRNTTLVEALGRTRATTIDAPGEEPLSYFFSVLADNSAVSVWQGTVPEIHEVATFPWREINRILVQRTGRVTTLTIALNRDSGIVPLVIPLVADIPVSFSREASKRVSMVNQDLERLRQTRAV
jgi:hypothetical protein